MIYVMRTIELPQYQVQDAWQSYLDGVMQWDKECVENVGGKFIGYWSTLYGRIGEITILLAYKSLDDRDKVLKAFLQSKDEGLKKKIAKWFAYTGTQNVKVMSPLPSSPLS